MKMKVSAVALIAAVGFIGGCSGVGHNAVSTSQVMSSFDRVASRDASNPKLKIIAVYHLPRGTQPSGIVMGSDGNLWFTLAGHLTIGRITPTGHVTYFPASKRDFGVRITRGPDKNLWFTVFGFPEIDRMTTSGTFTAFVVQGNPQDIVSGPDGALWYTDFTLQSYPYDITVGPDKNLWFDEQNSGKVGKITTAGAITEYTISDSNPIPVGIASAHGNIYAAENRFPKIAQITPAGVVTTYQSPQALNFLDLINDGHGRLIVSARYQGKIGMFDPVTHTFSSFVDVPKRAGETNAGPDGIALGPDGDIWFTSVNDDYIGVADDTP
jgi:streptogramin lyase